MVSKRRVITTNKEIYDKLNMLTFTNDVVIKGVSKTQINKILNNINKYSDVIDCEKIGNYFLLKRKGPLNFNVYFNSKKK